jgi:hypothetical protein
VSRAPASRPATQRCRPLSRVRAGLVLEPIVCLAHRLVVPWDAAAGAYTGYAVTGGPAGHEALPPESLGAGRRLLRSRPAPTRVLSWR